MIDLFYAPTPNGWKITIMLEEADVPYKIIPMNLGNGDQFKPEFLSISPNNRMPAIIDHKGPEGGKISVFESGAILLYLAEKTGKFIPDNTPKSRANLLSWLMFVATGIGPYSGQSVHFQHMAPEKIKYAINRYVFEAERHYDILNDRLANNKYMLGDTYTIVDMCVWGWTRMLPKVIGEGELEKRVNLNRLMTEINERPASQRATNINVSNNHNFKVEIDEEASRYMFPQNERLKHV